MQMTVRRRIVMMGRMMDLLEMAAAPKKGFDDNVFNTVLAMRLMRRMMTTTVLWLVMQLADLCGGS